VKVPSRTLGKVSSDGDFSRRIPSSLAELRQTTTKDVVKYRTNSRTDVIDQDAEASDGMLIKG